MHLHRHCDDQSAVDEITGRVPLHAVPSGVPLPPAVCPSGYIFKADGLVPEVPSRHASDLLVALNVVRVCKPIIVLVW
jgi:hypothetical protein